jgi:hypothetical protein
MKLSSGLVSPCERAGRLPLKAAGPWGPSLSQTHCTWASSSRGCLTEKGAAAAPHWPRGVANDTTQYPEQSMVPGNGGDRPDRRGDRPDLRKRVADTGRRAPTAMFMVCSCHVVMFMFLIRLLFVDCRRQMVFGSRLHRVCVGGRG